MDSSSTTAHRRRTNVSSHVDDITEEERVQSRKPKVRERRKRKIYCRISAVLVILVVYLLLARDHSSPTPQNSIYYYHSQRRDSELQNQKKKTLALLYPPGLMGGYRNQVIRFLAFNVYALQNNFTEILVDSIMWTTTMEGEKGGGTIPVPHDLLFDVEHWNTIGELPTLVSYDPTQTYDCWQHVVESKNANKLTQAVLERGFLTPISQYAQSVADGSLSVNPRKIDLLPNVSSCTNPAAYGGGRSAGRLWWNYMDLKKHAEKEGVFPYKADAKLLQALTPKQVWRNVAMQCVKSGTTTTTTTTSSSSVSDAPPPYLALHARVELEMMDHACGKYMEKNLTKIFDMVERLSLVLDKNDDNNDNNAIKGVFVAVARSGIEVKTGPWYNKYKEYADENLETINRVAGLSDTTTLGTGLRNGALQVFECGQRAVQNYYNQNPNSIKFGAILESIVNFHVATESTAFVGVRGSSYSTDIWTTRYHQGKGDGNYEYTPDGIKRIGNGGLPPPHGSCPRK